MAREESRSRIIEDGTTGDNMAVNPDGSINQDIKKYGGVATSLGQKVMASSLPVTMASNQPAIPVSMTNASQIRYSSVVQNFNLGTSGTEYPILLMRNPSGSGMAALIRLLGMNNITKTQTAIFRVYANPTVTSVGTTVPARYLVIGGISVAKTLITSSPVISAFGEVLHTYGTGANQNDLTRLLDATDTILSNNSYLVTGIGSNNNTAIDLTAEWTEA